MATFTGSLNVSVIGTLLNAPDLGTSGYNINYPKTIDYTSGTGANMSNMIWTDTRTLTASSTENLDLAGVLTDSFGAAITFTAVKGIMVVAASGNTNDVLVGGAASAAFVNWVSDATDKVIVQPGGVFCIGTGKAAGYPVTATTADILKIANSSSGTSVTYDIIIWGNA